MKRLHELRMLSEDHHHGLVLARRSARAASSGEVSRVDATWAEAESRMRSDLEPHFQIEEAHIAPALASRGYAPLAARLGEDHAALRAHFAPGSGRSASELHRFARRLEDHIRFEERELFEAAQSILSPDELLEIAAACRRQRSP